MKGEEHRLQHADFGARLLSWLIDTAVWFGISAVAILAGVAAMMSLVTAETRGDMGAWFLLFFAVALVSNALSSLYLLVSWSRGGQTLGKRLTRLKVVRSDGRPLGIGTAVLRLLGYYLCLWTLSLGFLLAAFDRQGRGLHDFIAGTRVVRA